MDKETFVISEIRESGGYLRRLQIHGYNPFGQTINFEIHWEDFQKHPVTIGDRITLTIEYDQSLESK